METGVKYNMPELKQALQGESTTKMAAGGPPLCLSKDLIAKHLISQRFSQEREKITDCLARVAEVNYLHSHPLGVRQTLHVGTDHHRMAW